MVVAQNVQRLSTTVVLLLAALILLALSSHSSPLRAAEAPAISPGVHRVDRIAGGALNEILDFASSPIFSPDGTHLYFNRLQDQENAILVALSFDSSGLPFVAATASTATAGFEEFTHISIEAFNEAGTRAYASANLDEQSAVVVLARNPQSGELSVLQSIRFDENESVRSMQLTQDHQQLYVAVPTLEPERSSFSDNIIGFNTTAGQIIRYTLDSDGLLANTQSLNLSASAAAHQILLLDGDSRLLVSTDTTLTEYGIVPGNSVLTAALQTTAVPLGPPEPRSSFLLSTRDGAFVFALLQEDPGVTGGYLNAWSRDPASGALRLVDQVTPDGFLDNFLWRPYQPRLTADDNILLVPSFSGRFFAGSPSVIGCVNAFAIDEDTGTLRVMGIDCSGSSGRGLAQHPLTDQFYSIFHGLRPFTLAPPPITAIGIFEPGRILAPTNIHAAVLPTSRTLSNRNTNTEPVTFFSSVLNPGSGDAEQCTLSAPSNNQISLSYQATDPATDEPINPDTFDTSFSVPANGSQTLLITLSTFTDFAPQNVELEFKCLNAPVAPKIPGVNSMLMSASTAALPDLITGAATASNDGITRLPTTESTRAFAVSTINIGGEDEIRAIPTLDFSSFVPGLPSLGDIPNLNMSICETNPDTGACLADASNEVVRRIAADEIVTYTVFVRGAGSEVAFSPGVNRAFIVLVDSAGEVRGASSVAVTTQP